MEPKSSRCGGAGIRLRLLVVLHLLLLVPSSAMAFNYADALAKSIIFFEGQRSGKLPPGNRMPWRADSGLTDGAQYNVDLVGGYYDAGDNVKFGLPMAFSTTMLAWSVLDFGKFMGAELPNARAAVRWGADYLLKAHTAADELDSLASSVCPFYCSYSGYHDELLWGASWLHRASRNASFMSYVEANGMQLGAGDDDYSFSWDDKRVGTKVLLAKGFLRNRLQGLELYKAHSDSYICSLVPGTASFQSRYTPGGLLYREGSSNMQYVTTATFLMLAYAKYLRSSGATASCGDGGGGARGEVSAAELVAVAKRQVDYILGKNPAGMSYMVGFGARYPRHRRVGAVVGGPDSRDAFADDRGNFAQSEPATYINAPLVGALAYFAGTTK
uniref:Endoglucanase n=1 Tax=Oryza barthii TaxID=65489 RepID=A0A0D3GVR1_9ORYZ